MKRHYKFYLFTACAISFSASIGIANADNSNLIPTTMITEDSDDWVEVQNENGIKVLFSSYELDGNSYLKIKFENQTNKNIHLEWSLTNKESKVLINNYTNKIIANTAIDFIDATMPISINTGETVNDFSITIK